MKNKITIAIIIFSFAVVLAPMSIFAQETSIPTEPAKETIQPPQSIQQPQSQPESQPQQSKESVEQKSIPSQEESGNEEIDRRDFIEPREIQEVLRQIKDLKKEAAKILKKAKKAGLTVEINQIKELVSQITAIETTLKGSPDTISRDTLQDFYDSQAWEQLNSIRIKIELPNEIKMIERELKKLEKMVSKKTFTVDGVDIEKVKAKIEEIKNALIQAKENLAQNNLEEAQESLQVVFEGSHPGEIMGVLNRLSEVTKRLKRIKSEQIRNDIKEVLSPVYEAVDSGDFREANMLFNEIERDLWKILDSLRNKPNINSDMRARMDKLEEKLQLKTQGENNENNVKGKQQSYYRYKNYSASLLGKLINWLSL